MGPRWPSLLLGRPVAAAKFGGAGNACVGGRSHGHRWPGRRQRDGDNSGSSDGWSGGSRVAVEGGGAGSGIESNSVNSSDESGAASAGGGEQ